MVNFGVFWRVKLSLSKSSKSIYGIGPSSLRLLVLCQSWILEGIALSAPPPGYAYAFHWSLFFRPFQVFPSYHSLCSRPCFRPTPPSLCSRPTPAGESPANSDCEVLNVNRRLRLVLGFALLTTMTWLYHVLGPRVMVRAVSASQHPRFGTCCHLISRTVMLVANSSSRALRVGSLCKPTHKRRLWEFCLSGALQILDLIDWLNIGTTVFRYTLNKWQNCNYS